MVLVGMIFYFTLTNRVYCELLLWRIFVVVVVKYNTNLRLRSLCEIIQLQETSNNDCG